MSSRPARFLLGGAGVGMAFGFCPALGFFAELRNFQILLLELAYAALSRFLPARWMGPLGTAWGETAVLTVLGAAVGLAAGGILCLAVRISRRKAPEDSFPFAVALTAGLFFCFWSFAWSRIVLIHSSTRRMISPEGFVMTAVSAGIGWAAGRAVYLSLSWVSRRRLGKAWVSGMAALLILSIAFSPVRGAFLPCARKIERIVLLGADGATWDVALPMIKEGKLPNLASLMRKGSWGDLRTTLPWKSPIIWTSIATGKRESQHGIHDFVVRNPENQTVMPVSVSSRKVRAIWDIAGQAGLSVDVVNWYGGWPAEEINGVFVSSRYVYEKLTGRIEPESRRAEMDPLVAGLKRAGEENRLGSEAEAPWDEKVAAAAGIYLLEKDKPALHLIYLREIDDMHHFYWKYYAARRRSPLGRWLYGAVSPEEVKEKGGRIEAAYRRMDDLLGRILKLTGPETAVIVLSDHGGGIKAPGELNFNLNPVLAAWGLIQAGASGQDPDWTATRVADFTKRIWYEDRNLFVNRRPKGPYGESLSVAQERRMLESLAERLRKLKTSAGQRVVIRTRIEPSDQEALHLEARVNVRLKKGDTILADGKGIPVSQVVWETNLTGSHRMPGLIAMAGPGIKPGYRLRSASVLDITPTLLYWLGLPVADDMQGRVLLDSMIPALRRERPVRRIPTYERGGARKAAETVSTADEALLERLKSLGYIQ